MSSTTRDPESGAPPSELSLANRANAHMSWAHTENRSARTAPARAALDAKFLEQAGGDPVRAEHLRKAFFTRLALKSARARRKAQEQTVAAEAAEAELSALGGGSGDPPGAGAVQDQPDLGDKREVLKQEGSAYLSSGAALSGGGSDAA